jgi:hypothetical protein
MMDVDERVKITHAGAALGYLWNIGREQSEAGSLAGLLEILEKLLWSAADAGNLEESSAALHHLTGFLGRYRDEDRARMANELRTRIVQIATRASGPSVLAELRALPDDLIAAVEGADEFE